MAVREKKYSHAFNARYMTYKEVAKSFIISESFDTITRNEHTILTGARGCGKTTLLKMLHPKALHEWNTRESISFKENIPFFGIYIPADRQWKSQLDNFKKVIKNNSKLVDDVFRGVVNANILIATCDTFNSLLEINGCDLSFDVELSLKLIEFWRIPLPIPPSLDDIIIKLRAMVNEFNTIVQKQNYEIELPDICYSDFVDLISISIDCFEGVNKKQEKNISLKEKWALCFDELEIAPSILQKTIIYENLRSRNQKILFKLTSTPGLVELFDESQNESPSELDDFTTLKLWIYDNRSQKDWRSFCQKYMTNVLSNRYNKEINLDKLLGENDYLDGLRNSDESVNFSKLKSKDNTEYDVDGIMWFVMKTLQEYDKSFYSYLLRKQLDPLNPVAESRRIASSVHRKIKPIVLYRYYFTEKAQKKGKEIKLRSRNINTFCHGKNYIFDISDGNPRAFANLVIDFIDQVQFTGSGTLKRIPIPNQARIIEAFSENYAFLRIRNYPKNDIKNNSLMLWEIIDKIGNYFFNQLVLGDFNADPYILFYVDKADKQLQSFIEIALEAGAILKIEDEIPRQGIRKNINVYRLSYSLYPKYKLPKVDYNPIDLKRILNPKVDTPSLFNQ